jgi:outer membrane murein-binding lipoprotein Lpp
MGAVLAALPALSAGASTAGSVLTAVSAASTIIGGLSSIAQGQAAQEQAEIQSRQLELQGRMDAIRTNEELLQTLSRNNVAAVASGLQSAGSVEYAKKASMANAAEQLNIDRMNTKVKQAQVEAAGKAAKTEGLLAGIEAGVTAGDLIGNALHKKKKTK